MRAASPNGSLFASSCATVKRQLLPEGLWVRRPHWSVRRMPTSSAVGLMPSVGARMVSSPLSIAAQTPVILGRHGVLRLDFTAR